MDPLVASHWGGALPPPAACHNRPRVGSKAKAASSLPGSRCTLTPVTPNSNPCPLVRQRGGPQQEAAIHFNLRVWHTTPAGSIAHTAQLERGAGHAHAPGHKGRPAQAAAHRPICRPRGPLGYHASPSDRRGPSPPTKRSTARPAPHGRSTIHRGGRSPKEHPTPTHPSATTPGQRQTRAPPPLFFFFVDCLSTTNLCRTHCFATV